MLLSYNKASHFKAILRTEAGPFFAMFSELSYKIYWLMLRCQSVFIDPLNHLANSQPKSHIGKDLHHTALVGKRGLLKHRQVLHHAIVGLWV